jgi:hypothetical protein
VSDGSAVLQAHALQSATVTAALLHGSRRSARELARPYAPLIAGLVLGLVLLVAVVAAVKIDAALEQRRKPPRVTALELASDGLS